MVPDELKLKSTIKYPTTIIVGGASRLGLQIAESLIEQGGYVVIVDTLTEENIRKFGAFQRGSMVSFLDYTSIPHLEEDIRRLDYVFYFGHESLNFRNQVSTQEFLTFSNYLDATLSLASRFEAKFLLTTSIKANQILLSEQEVGMNFGIGSSIEHPAYTDMELQKNAEGLVLEYEKKIDLDARVVRLGEIIGEGMDFKSDTAFVRLILDAAQEKVLELKKDGLENEWYIHLDDASYALIKAQFSKGTKGRIFSASYDHSFTHLSVAYKIQEVGEEAREIRFIDERDNLPPIKLYKPAPNLSDIGWMPRISFDKAVKQSLAAAKIYLAEHNFTKFAGKKNGDGTVVSKLKGFLNLAKDPGVQDIFETEADVISRLVSNQRSSETLTKNRLKIAGDQLRAKRNKKPKTVWGNIKNIFWSMYISLSKVFTFLGRKSPLELGIMMFFFVIFIFLYFLVISPVVILTKNIVVSKDSYSKLITNIDERDYSSMKSNAEKLNSNLNSAIEISERYEGLAKVLTLDDEYVGWVTTLEGYALAASGFKDVATGMENNQEYRESYANNLQIRSSSDNYLTVLESGLDYSPILTDAQRDNVYIEIGLDKLTNASTKIETVDYSKLPTFLNEEFQSLNSSTVERLDAIESISSEAHIPEIVGVEGQQTQLVVVLDNTRSTPLGGSIAAFALLTFDSGSIIDVRVQSVNDVEWDFSAIAASDITEINSTRFRLTDRNNILITDLANIYDYRTFAQTARDVWGDTFDKEIDGVITINLNTLEELYGQLTAVEDSVIIQGVEFSGEFLNDLNSVQTSNESITLKNRAIAQTTAIGIHHIFTNFNTGYSQFINLFNTSFENQDILVDFASSEVNRTVAQENLNLDEINDSDIYIKPSLMLEDLKVVNVDRYPNIDLTVSSVLTSEGVETTLKAEFITNIGNSKNFSVCLPASVTRSSIRVLSSDIPATSLSVTESSLDLCAVVALTTQDEVTITWIDRGLRLSDDSVNITYGVGKVRGALNTLDFNLNAPGYGIALNNTGVQTSSYSSFEQLFTDSLVELQFSRE